MNPTRTSFHIQAGLWLLLVVLVTSCSFAPVFHNEFVNWDDDEHILHNPYVRDLSWQNLRWMFINVTSSNYQPLAWLSYAIDHAIWGLEPRGYFLTSLGLHIASAISLFFVARFLQHRALNRPVGEVNLGAGLAALLFAVHPLRVESVAWASERRDVLSGSLLLVSVLCYLCYAGDSRGGRRSWYIGSVLTFAVSLLAKVTGVGLPLALLVLDGYPLRRWKSPSSQVHGGLSSGVWMEKIPFVVLSMAAAAVAIYAQRSGDTLAGLAAHGPLARLACGAFGLSFYIEKSLAPIGLSPLVPMPHASALVGFGFLLRAAVVLLCGALLWRWRRRCPALVVASLWYLLFLLPVLGIVQIGSQLVADRYSYLSCMGFVVWAGGALQVLWWRASRSWRWTMLAIGLVALVCLCAGTRSQVRVWHDSISLWTRVLARYPDAATAHSNLASALGERGRDEEAMRRFQRAVALNPMLSEAHYGLGITRARRGELEQACLSFRRALSIRPRQVDYWNNLGGVLLQLDRASEAIDALEQASRLDPSNGLVQYNLGQALIRSGRLTEALARLRAAAALAPEVPSILETLAWSLATCDDDSLRNAEEALELATRSVRLTEGKSASCLDAQAAAYAELGRFDEAVTAASAALTIARATGDGRLADEIEQRLVMYRAGQPYHASHQ